MLSFGPESFHGPVQRKNLGATKHEVRWDKALCLTLSLDIGELGQKPSCMGIFSGEDPSCAHRPIGNGRHYSHLQD